MADGDKMVKRYLRRCFIACLLGSCLWTPSTARYDNKKTFANAVVVSDSGKCSSMGKDVLKQHGSAVDAAIITVLCLGIHSFQSTGIGGGGHMTIYKRSTGTAEVIDFRETAPSGVADGDFKKPWKEGEYFIDPKLLKGGTAIGVPGMLKGMEMAHKRHGKYSWKAIFESAAKLAEKETHVSNYFLKHMYEDIAKYKKTEFKNFREFFASSSDGNTFKQNALAKTLRTIAAAGNAAPFYDGILSETIVNDVQESRGTITLEDLRNYRAILREPVELRLGDKKLYSAPPPAGGAILSSILNILSGYNFSKKGNDKNSDERSEIYHKMIESFKWSYTCTDLTGDPQFSTKIQANDFSCEKSKTKSEMRTLNQNIKDILSTEYGDSIRRAISADRTYNISHYNPDGLVGKLQGTTHVSVLAENGDAVAITSSLNEFFGSFVYSKKLGIFFNNQMKDFREIGSTSQSNSPETAKVILPGKRAPSLMSPTIIVDKDNNVVMVIGAAGGNRIPSVIAQVIARYLWLGDDLQSSTNEPRFHHQLQPNIVFVEHDISDHLRTTLKKLGHKISENIEMIAHYPLNTLAKINALVVERHKDTNRTSVIGVNDKKRRGGGSSVGY